MSHRQKALLRAVVLTVGISLAAAQSAQAALLLAGTAGGVNFCAADNNVVCTFGFQLVDLDPTVGRIQIGTGGGINIGGVVLSGALSTSTIGPPVNILNTSSFSVRNSTQLPVTVTELSTFDDSVKDDLLDAFATDSHQKSILDSPFSMTLGVDLTLVGGGTLLSLGQSVGSGPQ